MGPASLRYDEGVPHGIMFHHFHSEVHSSRPGSLSGQDFADMLDFLSEEFHILGPDEFAHLGEQNRLANRDIVLTFDDALLSQVDVAVPILRERGYAAIFSVYSSVFGSYPDPLEVFASFRAEAFPSFSIFLREFESEAIQRKYLNVWQVRSGFREDYLSDFPFYTLEERWFRFIRDEVLGPSRYFDVMWSMIESNSTFDVEEVKTRLWMKPTHLSQLISEGHSIGLHSHSHPTRIDELSLELQAQEYRQNFDWISANLNVKPHFVAHPCGRYSPDTLEILTNLGVKVGFRSSMSGKSGGFPLEVPREDHSNVLESMRKR